MTAEEQTFIYKLHRDEEDQLQDFKASSDAENAKFEGYCKLEHGFPKKHTDFLQNITRDEYRYGIWI
jgi:hypothetical protein